MSGRIVGVLSVGLGRCRLESYWPPASTLSTAASQSCYCAGSVGATSDTREHILDFGPGPAESDPHKEASSVGIGRGGDQEGGLAFLPAAGAPQRRLLAVVGAALPRLVSPSSPLYGAPDPRRST